MKTTSKRSLTVAANKSAKTFTLRFTYDDGAKIKYRTTRMSRFDFYNADNQSESDWLQFLKTDDYYKVS